MNKHDISVKHEIEFSIVHNLSILTGGCMKEVDRLLYIHKRFDVDIQAIFRLLAGGYTICGAGIIDEKDYTQIAKPNYFSVDGKIKPALMINQKFYAPKNELQS